VRWTEFFAKTSLIASHLLDEALGVLAADVDVEGVDDEVSAGPYQGGVELPGFSVRSASCSDT
jgi:hypothetical protein